MDPRCGSVMFDEPSSPENGGWASLAGGAPFRVKSPADLALNCIWLTNAAFSDFRTTGMSSQPHLRVDQFLKITVKQMLVELGLHGTSLASNQACVPVVSEIFSRISALAKREFGFDLKTVKTLRDGIMDRVRPASHYVNPEFHNACRLAQQAYSVCPSKVMAGSKTVSLRKNRVSHTVEVCSVPVPMNEFRLYAGTQLGPAKGRVERVCQFPEPIIANISIKSIAPEMMEILAFGSAPNTGRKQAVVRDWVTQMELMMLAPYADITIQSAYVGNGWAELNSKVALDPTPMDFLSFSYGILAENFRLAHSSESVKGTVSFLSPQALWLLNSDRFWSFLPAAKLAAAGYIVTGYGGGMVSVQGYPAVYDDIMRASYSMGLTFPLWLKQAAYESGVLEGVGGY